MQLPFLRFYTRDWRSDTQLRRCSFAARGLWIEMLSIMHESPERGFLAVGEGPLGESDLAAIGIQTGAPGGAAEVRKLLAELKKQGVYSVRDDGAIFSRRMVNDEAKSTRNRENGLRGGSPLLKGSDNPPSVKPGDKAHAGAIAGARSREARVHDRDPETRDQSTATPSSARVREVRPLTEPFGLSDWIWGAAFERGLIGEHRAPDRDDDVRHDLPAAKRLLDAYSVAEIQTRAHRFLAALHSGEIKKATPTASSLSRVWDFTCVAPPREAAPANGTGKRKFLDVGALD